MDAIFHNITVKSDLIEYLMTDAPFRYKMRNEKIVFIHIIFNLNVNWRHDDMNRTFRWNWIVTAPQIWFSFFVRFCSVLFLNVRDYHFCVRLYHIKCNQKEREKKPLKWITFYGQTLIYSKYIVVDKNDDNSIKRRRTARNLFDLLENQFE